MAVNTWDDTSCDAELAVPQSDFMDGCSWAHGGPHRASAWAASHAGQLKA